MGFFIKQRMLHYRKYKLDIWGVVRNSFLIEENWRKLTYKKLIRKYKMFRNAKKHNYKRIRNKKTDLSMGMRLNTKFLYKLKVFRNLIKVVFKLKPSKKLNKVCLFFFNRKKRRINLDWWKKKYFIYEVRDVYIKRKRYQYKKEFSDLRLAKNFYIIYTLKKLKKIVRKSKKKDGVFEHNFIKNMECKLSSFLYRAALLSNMFEGFNYIKYNFIAINKIFRTQHLYCVEPLDLVTIRIWEKGFIYWSLYKRLKKKAFLFFFPKYMYISIIFFFIIALYLPKKKDIINPIHMDFYKASSFMN